MRINDFRAINGLAALVGFTLIVGGTWNKFGLDAAIIVIGCTVVFFSVVGSRV